MADKKPKYMHTAANLHATGQGWRAATYVVAAVACGLLFMVARLDGAERIVLVPSHFSKRATGSVVVERNGEYASLLARADVSSLLDWTPQTVGSQFTAFLNRCAPALFSRLHTQMLTDARSYRAYDLSEVFYIRKVVFIKPATIQLTGWLDRYSGTKQVMHAVLTYSLSYNSSYAITKLGVEKQHAH